MNTTLSEFDEARQPLESVVAAIPADRWLNPSPCEGWTAVDVLAHVVGTQRDFFSERGLDAGSAPDLEADPAAAWRAHAAWVTSVLQDNDLVDKEYKGFFGPTTLGETFQTFYVWDMLVHRWDIATAAGVDAQLSASEVERIDEGAGAFGANLYMEGICKPQVDVDSSSDEATRVLAKLGRRA